MFVAEKTVKRQIKWESDKDNINISGKLNGFFYTSSLQKILEII